jgi:hypothetical protein
MNGDAFGRLSEHCVCKVHSDDLSARTDLFLKEREIEARSTAEVHYRVAVH